MSNEPTALIEFQSHSYAVMHAKIPRYAAHTVLVITSLVLSMIAILGILEVDQVVTVKGVVVSKSSNELIETLEPAIIRSILVREGDIVDAGQLLATLDPTFIVADVATLQQQLRGVEVEIARLSAEKNSLPFDGQHLGVDGELQLAIFGYRKAEYAARIETFDQKLNELAAQKQRAQIDILAFRERLNVSQEVENMRKELEGLNSGSRLATLMAIDSRAEIARNLANAENVSNSNEKVIAEMQAQKESYIQSWLSDVAQKLADGNFRLNELREQLNKAKRRNELSQLKAISAGVVKSIAKVSVGSVLQPGQTLMTVVPINGGLELEANIPGQDVGFVKIGDAVTVKFDTLPFATYGQYHGQVRRISPDAFIAQAEARNFTSSVGSTDSRPYYRTVISLDQSKLYNLPASFRLVPGMPVTADIKFGDRSILSYFFQKMIPVFKEGFREP